VARPDRNAAYKPHGGAKNSSSLEILNAAYSFTEQHPALGEFWRYRTFVMNHDVATKTLGIAKVAGAPTDMHNGSALTWTTQQISGADTANNTVPAATYVSASDQDLDDIAPGVLALDPVLASPTARTDSGTAADAGAYPLMLSRTLWVNGARPLAELDPDWRAKTGLLFKAYGSSYDFVTSNAAAAPTDSYIYQTTFIEFSYVKPTLSVLALGDSTNTGVGTTSGRFAPIDEAARLSRAAGNRKLMVPLKMASSGRRSAGVQGTLTAVVNAGLRPDVAVIPFWTVNDGSNPSQFATSRQNAFRAIDFCEQNGIIPILLTPPPYNGIGANLASWLAARSEVLSLASQMLVCDMAGKVCDVNTAQYLAGASGDGTHFNDASTPPIGAALYSTLKQLL
jgi:lysophospholipase L1-like esterase